MTTSAMRKIAVVSASVGVLAGNEPLSEASGSMTYSSAPSHNMPWNRPSAIAIRTQDRAAPSM
jgi:hypothetical protein